MSEIAKNIRKLRKKKEMTQEELAEKLFVTRQAVSNWETGKNQPDVEMLMNMAGVLEVDVKELLYSLTPQEQEQRRKRIIPAAVLCALAALLWVAFLLCIGPTAEAYRHTYIGSGYFFCVIVLRPLAFLLSGAAIPAVISVWRDLHPQKAWLLWLMLALAGGFLLVYIVEAGCVLFGLYNVRIGILSYSTIISWVWMTRQAWIFLIPGAFAFCGFPRKAG